MWMDNASICKKKKIQWIIELAAYLEQLKCMWRIYEMQQILSVGTSICMSYRHEASLCLDVIVTCKTSEQHLCQTKWAQCDYTFCNFNREPNAESPNSSSSAQRALYLVDFAKHRTDTHRFTTIRIYLLYIFPALFRHTKRSVVDHILRVPRPTALGIGVAVLFALATTLKPTHFNGKFHAYLIKFDTGHVYNAYKLCCSFWCPWAYFVI